MLKQKQYKCKLEYTINTIKHTEDIQLSCFLALSLPFLDESHLGCPYARLNDQLIHIVHQQLGIKKGIEFLLSGKNTNKFRQLGMRHIATSEFTLTPHPSHLDTILDLDGEVMPFSTIKAKVYKSSLIIMVPPWLDEDILSGLDRDQ